MRNKKTGNNTTKRYTQAKAYKNTKKKTGDLMVA